MCRHTSTAFLAMDQTDKHAGPAHQLRNVSTFISQNSASVQTTASTLAYWNPTARTPTTTGTTLAVGLHPDSAWTPGPLTRTRASITTSDLATCQEMCFKEEDRIDDLADLTMLKPLHVVIDKLTTLQQTTYRQNDRCLEFRQSRPPRHGGERARFCSREYTYDITQDVFPISHCPIGIPHDVIPGHESSSSESSRSLTKAFSVLMSGAEPMDLDDVDYGVSFDVGVASNVPMRPGRSFETSRWRCCPGRFNFYSPAAPWIADAERHSKDDSV
ncbi:hypothetical protein F5X68DRAFT_8914 [Plectosphaerella plurivora]|uniref:Uncharacterized protein n=1 Tax=Plectosphaerella plurivora TaxID=936078 RepID=A0A9P9ACJ3_9PEZI|nr:hypothetical protein F5X68DRAFT_8914 [Plectosphaerella plurivora]